MKRSLILILMVLIVVAFSFRTVSAQITITIPKLPKIKKPKVEQTTTTSGGNQEVENKASQESAGDEMDFRLTFFLKEIAETQKKVEEYTPEEKIYVVSGGLSEWLWRAVSMRERNEFYEKWKTQLTPPARKKFDDALNTLSATAAKKLPLYKANPKAYNFRNPAEEKMMKAELSNLSALKIHKIGLNQAAWLIDKNGLGIPISRYKNGMLWVRDTADDHSYCKFYYVNIIQDYAGGGTYGASYAKFVGSELAGCP